MTLVIHIFVQLWNTFPDELKTTKQKIIHTNVMGDLLVKEKMLQSYKHYNRRKYRKCLPCYKVKLTFCSCSIQKKKQKLKMAAKEWIDDKMFQFRNDLLWLGLGGNYLLWAKT